MDKVLFANRFLSIIEREGYSFLHEVRCDGKIISILPFRRVGRRMQYLARREVCPAHGLQPELCSITGGVDPGLTVLAAAQQELLEEAGYAVDPHELIDLGIVTPSKSSDTVAYLFAVDVTRKTPTVPIGDGSPWEKGASVEWVNRRRGLQICDPLFVVAIARLGKELGRGTKASRG